MEWLSDGELEARQQERLTLMRHVLDPNREARPRNQAPITVPEDDGEFIFARRAEQQAEAEAEHRLRRRRADAEVTSQERLHARYRDAYGLDEADRMTQ